MPDYKNNELRRNTKHALAVLSLDIYFPGDAKYVAESFLEYIALQYHLALFYLYKEQPDLLNAIRFAEQARIDMLSTGVAKLDPRMRPFYTLLMQIYSSKDTDAQSKSIAEVYNNLLSQIYPQPVGTPQFPDVNSEKYILPNLYISGIDADEAISSESAVFKAQLAGLYVIEAKHFLEMEVLDQESLIDTRRQTINGMSEYSALSVRQSDIVNTIICMQRAGCLILKLIKDLFGVDNHPWKKAIHKTTQENFNIIIDGYKLKHFALTLAQVESNQCLAPTPPQQMHVKGNRPRSQSFNGNFI